MNQRHNYHCLYRAAARGVAIVLILGSLGILGLALQAQRRWNSTRPAIDLFIIESDTKLFEIICHRGDTSFVAKQYHAPIIQDTVDLPPSVRELFNQFDSVMIDRRKRMDAEIGLSVHGDVDNRSITRTEYAALVKMLLKTQGNQQQLLKGVSAGWPFQLCTVSSLNWRGIAVVRGGDEVLIGLGSISILFKYKLLLAMVVVLWSTSTLGCYLFRRMKWHRREALGRCRNCSYPVSGNARCCPECGEMATCPRKT
jgi:hypothetical protein